jgi:Cu-Zn family superoxide dismutase
MRAIRTAHLVVVAVLLTLVGCAGVAPTGKRAMAELEAKNGSTVTGTAAFSDEGPEVTMTINIKGASPGTHAIHLHVTGDCSAADAASAGAHWNPDMMNHGLPSVAAHHAGDCGNFLVGADGTALYTITAPWTIGTGDANTDIVGHAVIIHANLDDGVSTMPTPGNSGARIACGVIKL